MTDGRGRGARTAQHREKGADTAAEAQRRAKALRPRKVVRGESEKIRPRPGSRRGHRPSSARRVGSVCAPLSASAQINWRGLPAAANTYDLENRFPIRPFERHFTVTKVADRRA